MKKHVITISRELGSGGNVVAKELSARLDMPYYDKDIINKTAQEYGLPEEDYVKRAEKKNDSFLYSLATAVENKSDFRLNDIIKDDMSFMYTGETIKHLAEQPCIIVGRCADFVLQNRDIIKIFICADMDDRMKRISESLGISEKNALKLINKTDKHRAAYYNSYTDKEWGKVSNYHMTINTSALGIEKSVEILSEFIQTYNEKH